MLRVVLTGDLDLRVVDALARLRLACKRSGVAVDISDDELLALTGLSEVWREPEEREQGVGVQEVVDVPDLPA